MELDANQRTVLSAMQRKFIDGCHILHYHGVLDAYGHLSFRHPFNAQIFIMSRAIAPGTVTSPDDLIEYKVPDAEPLDPALATKGYLERHIHSAVYLRHPGVQAVIHSHAESVIPYTITGVPLRPCLQMAGFLGLGEEGHPGVYDAADFRAEEGGVPDLLVRSARLGEGLAGFFDRGSVVTLMRGHGMTVIDESIETVVARAIFTVKNASIQTAALTMQAAAFAAQGGGGGGRDVKSCLKYLDRDESNAETDLAKRCWQRPWNLWVREVEACGLYVNSA